jgi:phytoene dehydrogenase-like protein
MALDRGRVRRTPGLRFAKLLGTGDGRTFTARDADPLRWGLLTTWADARDAARFSASSPVVRAWERLAVESFRIDLRPSVSRGRWSGRAPFGDPAPVRESGPVAAITRARLRPSRAAVFWRAVPPVSADLHTHPGLRTALGIGEAPLGLQGTFSLWDDAQALRTFAHRSAPHVDVVRRTAELDWYAEELFARFAVVGGEGHARRAGRAGVTAEVVRWPAEQVRARRRRGAGRLRRGHASPARRRPRPARRPDGHLDRDGFDAVAAVDDATGWSASPTATRRAPAVVARPRARGAERRRGTRVARRRLRGVRAARAPRATRAAARAGTARRAAAAAAPPPPCSRRRTWRRGPAASTAPPAGSTWRAGSASPATRAEFAVLGLRLQDAPPSRVDGMTLPRPAADRAVVVGAGHNGLVAALLPGAVRARRRGGRARHGGRRRRQHRGALPRLPDGPRLQRHIMVRHTGIVEELALEQVGLHYQDLDPWGWAPSGPPDEQQAITFHVDLDRTCASVEQVCGTRDADAYRAFVLDWSARNTRGLRGLPGRPTCATSAARSGASARAPASAAWSSPAVPHQRDSLLDEHFDDERLKTALAWMGAQSGPPTHEVATADLVGWNTMMHLLPPGHPKGGSGMLSEALQRRLESYGGRVRLGDGAAAITTAGGRATGVLTESGEHLPAGVVVTGCHVLTTVDLLGDGAPGDLATRAHRSIRTGNGIGMVVRLGTSRCRSTPPAPTRRTAHAAHRAEPAVPAQAHGEYSAGLPPEHPAALAMTFSAFDDTIARPASTT